MCFSKKIVNAHPVQAQKEVDGLKKKIADLETKLKAVTSDKQQALQVGHSVFVWGSCKVSANTLTRHKFPCAGQGRYGATAQVRHQPYQCAGEEPGQKRCTGKGTTLATAVTYNDDVHGRITQVASMGCAMQAEKRRESMALGLNKTKEQLNSTESRCQQLTVDLQRLQMDMMAKTGKALAAVLYFVAQASAGIFSS
jgi:hypothetical protein